MVRWLGAIALVLGFLAPGGGAVAQTYIEKLENKALKGAAYSRLRNLTYEQCEQACLKDAQCVALEHFRGGGLIRRSSNCALFSSIERSADAKNSDIGFKRRSVAFNGKSGAKRSAAPRGGGASGDQRGAETARRYAPTPGWRTEEVRPAERSAEGAGAQPSRERRTASEAEDSRSSAARRAEPEPIPDGRPAEATPPPPPAPPPAPAAAPRAASRSIRGPAATPAPPLDPNPKAGPDDRFHIVPVFYGTDRNRVKVDNRIGYANDRAKRLEMGRALVSVPLDHKVPNIERPRAWTIPYIRTIQLEKEDPNKHFTVREITVLGKNELLALAKARLASSQTFRGQSIVFIHGYNMSFDDALYRTAQISYDLQFDGAAFAYSWPSGGGLASYIYDRDSAQGAERYLYEFLQMVQNETGSQSVNIIAHSMGNQMLLQVLRSLRLRAPGAMARINQIILAAPDVDRDAFEALAAEITGIAKGITLYASAKDRALEASRFVAGNKPRAGDVPESGPVIIAGIDTIDISQLSTGYLALHHSGYAEHSDLLTDIGQIIRIGTRPWTQRLPAYKPVTIPAGTYWRYEQ